MPGTLIVSRRGAKPRGPGEGGLLEYGRIRRKNISLYSHPCDCCPAIQLRCVVPKDPMVFGSSSEENKALRGIEKSYQTTPKNLFTLPDSKNPFRIVKSRIAGSRHRCVPYRQVQVRLLLQPSLRYRDQHDAPVKIQPGFDRL